MTERQRLAGWLLADVETDAALRPTGKTYAEQLVAVTVQRLRLAAIELLRRAKR